MIYKPCFNCLKGVAEKQRLLESEESIFIAVDKFVNFVKLCENSCNFKNIEETEEKQI